MKRTLIKKISLLLPAVVWLWPLASPGLTQPAEPTYPIRGCQGQTASTCRESECVCKEWQIDVNRANGKRWGLIVGKSLESVQKQLRHSQEFEESYARFFHEGVTASQDNYQTPGTPVCVADCPPLDSETQANDRILEEAASLGSAAEQEIVRVTVSFGIKEFFSKPPFDGMAQGFKDYVNTLLQVRAKQQELMRFLHGEKFRGDIPLAQLQARAKELEASWKKSQIARQALPPALQKLIATGRQPAAEKGDWRNQQLADFDGHRTTQTISLDKGVVTVVSERQSESGRTTQFVPLASLALQPAPVPAQVQGKSGLWVLVVPAAKGEVTKETGHGGQAGVSDRVSKLTLYFTSQAEASAAAAALAAN